MLSELQVIVRTLSLPISFAIALSMSKAHFTSWVKQWNGDVLVFWEPRELYYDA